MCMHKLIPRLSPSVENICGSTIVGILCAYVKGVVAVVVARVDVDVDVVVVVLGVIV